MLVVAAGNEVSYVRTLYLLVWHFLWGSNNEEVTVMRPLLKNPWAKIEVIDIPSHEEEAGVDNETANRIRRELNCIEENIEASTQDHNTYILSYYK
jgi:hypothetical protein